MAPQIQVTNNKDDRQIKYIFQGLGLLACSGSEFIFWNLWTYWTLGRTPWTGGQPDARPVPTHRTTQHRKTRTHIHAWSGIGTYDPNVRATEDSTCHLNKLGSSNWRDTEVQADKTAKQGY